jgi:hypothetical protein
MATQVEWTVTTQVTVSPEMLAKIFTEMDDDAQAQFFVHVARIVGAWTECARADQIFYIARHLHQCECSTAAARAFVCDLADWLAHWRETTSGHGAEGRR